MLYLNTFQPTTTSGLSKKFAADVHSQGMLSSIPSSTSLLVSVVRTSSTLASSRSSSLAAKGVPRSSASSSSSASKWACHLCTFLNRNTITVCSMCRNPWQPPSASILAATTLVFPLPVPQGYKVVGQDAEGFWSFQKEHEKESHLLFFRHRLLDFTSSSNSSSSSPLTARLKRSRACVNSGAEREVDLVTNTYFATNSIPSAPLLSAPSSLSVTGFCESLEYGNSNKRTKSVGATRNSSNFVVVDNGVVIEELAVDHDKVDGFELSAFASEFSGKRQCRFLN
mmetsp:Transcript_73239/g.147434  ORF Transcript_73239/g.147434 Transcript_73239/m.147434 type:complete len:283 (+) Transcript_73239:330-1178(+)